MKKVLILGILALFLSSSVYGTNIRTTFYLLNDVRGWCPYRLITSGSQYNISSCGYTLLEPQNVCPFENLVFSTRRCNSMGQLVPAIHLTTDITIPKDLKLVNSNGAVIRDKVCEGDDIKIVMGPAKGEWWLRGAQKVRHKYTGLKMLENG